jgi:hypothetical protein
MWEPQGYGHSEPVRQQALTKFDGLPRADRLLDTGDVAVYDVKGVDSDS